MTEDSSPTSSPRRDRQLKTSSASHTKLVIVIVFICSLASIYYSSINLAGCNDKQRAAVARQEDAPYTSNLRSNVSAINTNITISRQTHHKPTPAALPSIQKNTNATTLQTFDIVITNDNPVIYLRGPGYRFTHYASYGKSFGRQFG